MKLFAILMVIFFVPGWFAEHLNRSVESSKWCRLP